MLVAVFAACVHVSGMQPYPAFGQELKSLAAASLHHRLLGT